MKATELVDAVGSNSAFVLDRHVQLGCFAKAEKKVIYNIVQFQEDLETGSAAKNEKSDRVIFGYIGRVEQEKGIEVLLKATQLLQRSNWKLRIAGHGTDLYVETLKKEYSDPRIEWLGYVDKEQFYSSTEVTIIPSIWPEPLPRTLIESIACGHACICAESGGIPEIAHFGIGVQTYLPNSESHLASIMENALNDPPAWKMGGWKDVNCKSLFSEDHVTSRYLELYTGS
jgi:glycosyltransferase involved in cell wall biosynthesis